MKFQIDADGIAAQFKEFAEEVKKNLEKGMNNLATITRREIVQHTAGQAEGQSKDDGLNTSRSIYMEALGDVEEVAEGVWVISLDEKALWIEEGIEKEYDMKPGLLNGKPYRVIPFKYDKGPSQNSPLTQALVSQVKQHLKDEKVPFKTLERNQDGSPKVGKLHEWDINKPISIRPGKGNTPALTRLSVYQTEDKQTKEVKRDILTFRTVSAGPASDGKWMHPGYEGKKYMDKALTKAVKIWENQILPEIMAKWSV